MFLELLKIVTLLTYKYLLFEVFTKHAFREESTISTSCTQSSERQENVAYWGIQFLRAVFCLHPKARLDQTSKNHHTVQRSTFAVQPEWLFRIAFD